MFGLIIKKTKEKNKLADLVTEGVFSYSDCFFAQTVLSAEFHAASEEALAIAYLFFASRMGHICVDYSNSAKQLVDPQFSELLNNHSDKEDILNSIHSGFLLLQKRFQSKNKDYSPIVIDQQRAYLQINWKNEQQLILLINQLLSSGSENSFDTKKFQMYVKRLFQEKLISEVQTHIINQLISHRLFILSGGPGTGKSYLIRYIIETFLMAQVKPLYIAVVAPTGKAAMLLQEKLYASFSSQWLDQITFGTLHSAIKYKQLKAETVVLPYDLIVVDEASMIELPLMVELLSKIKGNGKLVLVGDAYQLPPVEQGDIFYDLCFYPQVQKTHSIEFLNKPYRYHNETLYAFSQAILMKDLAKSFELIQDNHSINWRKIDGAELAYNRLREVALENFPHPSFEPFDIVSLLQTINRFRILSALNKGAFGCEVLNTLIFKALHKDIKPKMWWAVPIIVTRNDKELNLFNGMMGMAVGQYESDNWFSSDTKVYFPGYKEDLIVISLPMIQAYEKGYCLTVHKVQGSEFDHVTLILPDASEVFGNELLYTAVTRAKKEISLFANEDTLEKLIKKGNRKISGLQSKKTE